MAKSTLFNALHKATRLAQLANHLDRPIEELAGPVATAQRLASRRDFLRVGAYAGAGLALSACVPARLGMGGNEEEVAIVGAGIAGLTAAYRLRQAGVRVRVFEAQSRIGGRMLSLRGFFPAGQVCELGGELIDSGHTHMRGLAQELGLELDDLLIDKPGIEQELWFAGGRRYTTAQVGAALQPLLRAVERDMARVGDGDITYKTPQGLEALDRQTLGSWLRRQGLGGWALRLVETAYATEMGLDCDQQSALNFHTFVGTDPFAILGESDERFHVRGGNDLVVQGLGKRLDDAIEPGQRLEALRQEADGGFTLSFIRDSAATEVRAQRVLLALPFSLLRQVRLDVPLSPVKRRSIGEMRYGTNAKLMIGFASRTWREKHNSNGSVYSDLPFQTSWETSRAQAGAEGILTNFVGGAHGLEIGQGTPEHQAGLAVRDLEKIFPGIAATRRGAREVRMHWPSHPYVQGSFACFTPGQWTGINGAAGEPEGRLFFAGEHTSLAAQGFMEGGCESGARAAAEILADLKAASRQAGLVRRLAYGSVSG
ncbi:MAG TPA: FAD-dependent oxidoreductase [Solimonas sp.]|nr:FAD-dependent oxidoreductase [Solimonas sp.]